MTQVKEIKNEGLMREFTVTVPSSVIDQAFNARLQEIGKTAKIQGFRPGKAPLTILKQRYGDGVRGEILDKTVSDCAEQALKDRNLTPALQPKVELVSFGEGKDLEFKLAVEVLPEIAPVDFAKLSLTRSVAEVEDATVDEAITRLAKTVQDSEVVTEKRAAKLGDIVVINFDGTVDGTPFPGMKGEDHKLELGSKSFIDTFEEQLVGLKVGGKKDVTVTFPADYNARHLAGKTAVFAVEVTELRAPKAAELNDELAKQVGFESLAALRKHISDDIAANYTRISRAVLKRQLMDALADKQKFDVPAGLVAAEFDNIWHQLQQDKAKGEMSEADAKKSDETLKADYRAIAERRVRLGLLLNEVSKKNKIDVEQGDLRNALLEKVRQFPGREKAVFDYFTKTQGAMESLRAPLLEEKIVDYILAQAKVVDKKISSKELLALPELED